MKIKDFVNNIVDNVVKSNSNIQASHPSLKEQKLSLDINKERLRQQTIAHNQKAFDDGVNKMKSANITKYKRPKLYTSTQDNYMI
jgi:hypothetical protein